MNPNRTSDRGDGDQTARAPADSAGGVAVPAREQSVGDEPSPETATVCIVGLGYVGLPLALALDETGRTVVGFDIDREKVGALEAGADPTGDVGEAAVAESDVRFTAEAGRIERADVVIVTVPTPIDDDETPNLAFVEAAGETVGEHLAPDTTVVLESTVYPGATRDVLVPAIEETSGYSAGEEFAVGYSPERASPGEEGRGVEDVVKIVGADDDEVRERLAALYESVVDAGVYRAPDIETAEMAKVIENVQRDLNIALVNELSLVCETLDLSTDEVLAAAGSKWNFHDEYAPGLVGGHCIPVDPHYLAHRSERNGFSPSLILQAREINESVPGHVADLTVKALNEAGKVLRDSDVLVLGLAYKPNVGDIRTSEVDAVVDELDEYGIETAGFDPHADEEAVRETFDVDVQSSLDPSGFDGVVLATAHDEFADLDLHRVADAMADDPVLMDVPGAVDEPAAADAGFVYRQL